MVVFIKVLFTTDLYTTKTNGVVTSISGLVAELKKRGHDVKILTLSENSKSYKDSDVYYIDSISLEWVYPNVRMPASPAKKLIKELIKWKPDIIHSQCECFTYSFAKWIAKKTKTPIVHTYHTLYEDYLSYVLPFKEIGKWAVRKFISKERIRRAKTIIAPTEKVREYLSDVCKIGNDIVVIPSGIDLGKHRIEFTEEERREGRAKYGFTDDNFVFINLGRIGTEKKLDEVITYFSKVAPKYDYARLLIVGDGPAMQELKNLVRELEIENKVVFAGMVPPEQVARYYRLGDIFVCASRSETQGLTFIEAAANNLPILCYNDECLDGVVIEGVNAFMYSDSEEYEEHVEFIMNNHDWVRNAGLKSGEMSDKYDTVACCDNVEALDKKTIDDEK